MDMFPLLASGSCTVLASATLTVEVLRRFRGPNATLQNMRERALAWWILLGIGLPLLAVPAPGPVILFAGIAWLALREYLHAIATPGRLVALWLYFALPLAALALYTRSLEVSMAAGVLIVFLLAANSHRRVLMGVGAGLCLIGTGSLAWLAHSGFTRGFSVLLLTLTVTQLSDALQYIGGKLFGRTKLAPTVSAGKSVEGALFGTFLACGVGTGLAPLWDFPFVQSFALSALAAALGLASGLLLSAVKRRVGIKDWGALLTGHGGMLDRVDSLLISAPAGAAVVALGWLGV